MVGRGEIRGLSSLKQIQLRLPISYSIRRLGLRFLAISPPLLASSNRNSSPIPPALATLLSLPPWPLRFLAAFAASRSIFCFFSLVS